MRKAKKWLALLMAIGMMVGVASCAGGQAKADANDPATEKYLPTISVAVQGQTIALLDGDVYKFASNYSIGCGKDYTEGDFMVDRYAPKPATLTWENSREGALYYTVKVGLDKELSDADSYLVQDTSIDIDYLFVGKHYYYQIYAHYENDEVVKSRVFDFYTADLPRTVYIDGVSNTRDLGGRLTVDGTHRVKQGMVYRGGEVDHSYNTKAAVKATVQFFNGEKIAPTGNTEKGLLFDMGMRVTLKTDDDLYIIVSEYPNYNHDKAMMTSMNVDPTQMKVIIQKTHQMFKEGYRGIIGTALYADTEGFTDRNIPRLPFKNVRHPLYPIDDIQSAEPPIR